MRVVVLHTNYYTEEEIILKLTMGILGDDMESDTLMSL
jgi:hypothetical protein